METEKISVWETSRDDIEQIIAIERANPEFIGQYNFDEHNKVISSSDGLHLSIFDKSDNALVGYMILLGLDEPNDAIEFRRIAISKKGLGFGKDAVEIVKWLCFSKYRKHRLHLSVFSDNAAAIKLYESLGFATEGLCRDCIKSEGRFRSLWKMSMLESEYAIDP